MFWHQLRARASSVLNLSKYFFDSLIQFIISSRDGETKQEEVERSKTVAPICCQIKSSNHLRDEIKTELGEIVCGETAFSRESCHLAE